MPVEFSTWVVSGDLVTRAACSGCSYSLVGLANPGVCPECNLAFRPAAQDERWCPACWRSLQSLPDEGHCPGCQAPFNPKIWARLEPMPSGVWLAWRIGYPLTFIGVTLVMLTINPAIALMGLIAMPCIGFVMLCRTPVLALELVDRHVHPSVRKHGVWSGLRQLGLLPATVAIVNMLVGVGVIVLTFVLFWHISRF